MRPNDKHRKNHFKAMQKLYLNLIADEHRRLTKEMSENL